MTTTPIPASQPEPCTVPPEGWYCTRTAGHEGPCAAIPSDDADNFTPEQEAIYQRGVEDGKLIARGMARLAAGMDKRKAESPARSDKDAELCKKCGVNPATEQCGGPMDCAERAAQESAPSSSIADDLKFRDLLRAHREAFQSHAAFCGSPEVRAAWENLVAYLDARRATAGTTTPEKCEGCEGCEGKGGWKTAEWIDPESGPECEVERCGDCNGTGIAGTTAAPICPECKGTGEVDSGGVHPWGEPAMMRCGCESATAGTTAPEYESARNLALAIWRDNYKDTAPQWEPLDDLAGVISQIDNMVCGMKRVAGTTAAPRLACTYCHSTKQEGREQCGECGKSEFKPWAEIAAGFGQRATAGNAAPTGGKA